MPKKPVQLPKISMNKVDISIDINKEMQTMQQTRVGQTGGAAKRGKAFTDTALREAWDEFAASAAVTQEHVRQMLAEAGLERSDGSTLITVKVSSFVQKSILEENSDALTRFLRERMGNDLINLKVAVRERDKTVRKVMTDTDRFQQMLAENEAFRRLAAELSLEVS